MNSTPPSPLVRKIGRVFQLIILLGLCTFAVWRTLLYFEINQRFAQIRAGGFPTSGEELNAWRRPVPDAENGALVMTQAFALVRTYPDHRSNEVLKAELLFRTNVWSAATRELVEPYVHTNMPALAKAREALRLSRFRYAADFSYGPDTALPHLGPLKNLARIAALQCGLEAEDGHADEWPGYAELALKLAATLDEEPASISYLVRCSMISMASRATERSLNRVTPSDEACQKLQAAFTQADKTNLLPFILVGERATLIPCFRLSWAQIEHSSEDETDNAKRTPQRYLGKANPFLWFTGFLERDLNFFLQTMEKSIVLVALPPPASFTLTNHMESASTKAHKRLFIMSSLLLPALDRVALREASTQASLRLAATALAVERFRLQHQHLPETLAELTPQFIDSVPSDPFDGAPLRYRKLARGYVLYSVGADGHDDGGREAPARRKSNDNSSYDITFIVEH